MDQKGVVTKSISRIVDANMLDEVPKVDKVSMEKGRGLRSQELPQDFCGSDGPVAAFREAWRDICRSEEHTSELQSLMRISSAVFCLKKTTNSPYTPYPRRTCRRHHN